MRGWPRLTVATVGGLQRGGGKKEEGGVRP
uniref:Uncharacterized protein n=1 Tax=Arundo donax TaxID=35708 RepID=A0A0A9FYW9_ARUDO